MRKNDGKHYFSSEEIQNLWSLVNDMELCARIAINNKSGCADTIREREFLTMKLREYSASLRIGCKLIHPDRAKYNNG